MADQASSAAATAGENELVATRVIRAPKETVFDAWTDPELLARWWGPKGFTNTFSEFDPRPGGTWTFVMHGPNGADYANTNVFVEVVRPERIVLKHVLAPVFELTATFEETGGGTLIVFRQRFEEAAVYEQVKGYAANGNEENLDKLSALVTGLTS
ncbi:SRPBCC family protein [Paenibacillus glycinis]|uniref:Polyketide cyclase n=1 Tax=Paenibacillus glycinis TaxID=2697035 RepID=A0ABW9XXQ9_9BACL|nr:SRPBCC family protein [Paenibacillus glycinis]NBD27481.1 polyketide cyclase [Paenibacillus glycinis]